MHRGQDLAGLDLADMSQRILQHPLLHGHLSRGREVLHGTTSALTEIAACGLDSLGGRLQDAFGARNIERRLAPCDVGLHPLARQGALDEDDFAIMMRHAPGFQIQGFDIKYFGHKKGGRKKSGANCKGRAGAAENKPAPGLKKHRAPYKAGERGGIPRTDD